jgi:tetratricopeptide (TPR) repeat protein
MFFAFPSHCRGPWLDSIEDVMPLALALAAVALTLPVPFEKQKKDACGAASLTMVLRFWEHDIAQEQITDALLEPELRGIPGSRLAEFARERGLQAVAYAGDLAHLRDFVGKGRPLIVALKVGRDRYHNVVVTGFDDDREAVVVNDPEKGPDRRVARQKFEEQWTGGNHWTLLVMPAAVYEAAGDVPEVAPPAPSAPAQDYESLVALGISLGREGKNAEAAAAFDRAIAMDGTRPEARVERGGLRFVERRYTDAVRDLEDALAVRDDGYARNLLASSYQLAGRSDDALKEWNELGRPVLGATTFTGLRHIRTGVVRRELTVHEGEMLDLGDLRESRRRLEEVGVFSKVVLRAVPREEGKADLEVAVKERHGFGGWLEFLGRGAANAATEKVRLKYNGLFGHAINVGAYYRWEKERPKKSALLEWSRFLWIPFYFRFQVDRETQPFNVGGLTTLKAESFEVGARRVIGPRTVIQLGFRNRDREFSALRADTHPGVVRGLALGLEHRFWESRRRRLDWSLSGFKSGKPLRSDVDYSRALTSLRYEDILSTPEDVAMEKSVIVTRALAGWGEDDTPLDDLFALGVGSSDTDFPLRSYKLREDGVMTSPMGRTLLLFNIEWRQRLVSFGAVQGGFVLFYDAAHITRVAEGSDGTLEALGGGLRVAVRNAILRLDYGISISGDRRKKLTAGFGHTF